MNSEFESMLKEAVVAKFKVIFRHWPEGTEEDHENLSQDSRSPDRELNPWSSEYEAVVLNSMLRR
jgi:hypothetical protein